MRKGASPKQFSFIIWFHLFRWFHSVEKGSNSICKFLNCAIKSWVNICKTSYKQFPIKNRLLSFKNHIRRVICVFCKIEMNELPAIIHSKWVWIKNSHLPCPWYLPWNFRGAGEWTDLVPNMRETKPKSYSNPQMDLNSLKWQTQIWAPHVCSPRAPSLLPLV